MPSIHFRPRRSEAPEINLIPFIDVLLVVLIFLILSTTYSRYTELKVQLPSAQGAASQTKSREILVTVSSSGIYSIGGQEIQAKDLDSLHNALENALTQLSTPTTGGNTAAAEQELQKTVVIINADANAAHQSVITVMDVARKLGLSRITFATQSHKKRGRQ